MNAKRADVLKELETWHKEMIDTLCKRKNGAVSVVSIRSAIIQHEKSIEKIKALRDANRVWTKIEEISAKMMEKSEGCSNDIKRVLEITDYPKGENRIRLR